MTRLPDGRRRNVPTLEFEALPRLGAAKAPSLTWPPILIGAGIVLCLGAAIWGAL